MYSWYHSHNLQSFFQCLLLETCFSWCFLTSTFRISLSLFSYVILWKSSRTSHELHFLTFALIVGKLRLKQTSFLLTHSQQQTWDQNLKFSDSIKCLKQRFPREFSCGPTWNSFWNRHRFSTVGLMCHVWDWSLLPSILAHFSYVAHLLSWLVRRAIIKLFLRGTSLIIMKFSDLNFSKWTKQGELIVTALV